MQIALLAFHRFRNLFFHDTPQALRLVLVATAGFVAIGLWGLYADLFLSNLVTVAISQVLMAIYVIVMAVLLERLVRSHDRWQVESALTFRQLLADAQSFSGDIQAGSPFYGRRLREQIGEHIRRCEQYGTSVAVVAFRLELPGQTPSHAIFMQLNRDVADLVTRHSETILCPTALGLFEYVAILPNCDRRSAASIVAFMKKTLGKYNWHTGVAIGPEDGRDAETLLTRAVAECGAIQSFVA